MGKNQQIFIIVLQLNGKRKLLLERCVIFYKMYPLELELYIKSKTQQIQKRRHTPTFLPSISVKRLDPR